MNTSQPTYTACTRVYEYKEILKRNQKEREYGKKIREILLQEKSICEIYHIKIWGFRY